MSMVLFDYLIVGAGLTGAVLARELTDAGKKCLVVDRREHVAGNIYTQQIENIHVHRYGAHIFHTNEQRVWDYLCKFTQMNHYVNSPVANYKGAIYNLPFNMNTFNRMWGVTTPQQAQAEIEKQRKQSNIKEPQNLEEQAISLVGVDIYEKLIKDYTEKQWGRPCKDLPAPIIKRLPVRFTYDNNYFNAKYQGIPMNGYTSLIEKLLENVEVCLNVDYLHDREHYDNLAPKVIYSGCIDEFFDYSLGALSYRSVRFETETLPINNYQGNAVVNYTDKETPYTRIIEHKHFTFGDDQATTIISREYSAEWTVEQEPYYPVNDEKNARLYQRYVVLAKKHPNVVFTGRLGCYQYWDMDQCIAKALDIAKELLSHEQDQRDCSDHKTVCNTR